MRGKFSGQNIAVVLVIALLLVSGGNLINVLFFAAIFSDIIHGEPSILSDIPALFQFYVSTFPLTLTVTIILILIFWEKLKNPFAIALTTILTFHAAIWLGEELGAGGGVDLTTIPPGTEALWNALGNVPFFFSGVLRILLIFYAQYGAYKFFSSLIIGAAIAWAFFS
jgi:hypothetical protein